VAKNVDDIDGYHNNPQEPYIHIINRLLMRHLPIDVLGYKPPIASIDRMRILVSAFLSIRAAVQSIGGYFLSMAFQERFNNGPTAETNPIYIYIYPYI